MQIKVLYLEQTLQDFCLLTLVCDCTDRTIYIRCW